MVITIGGEYGCGSKESAKIAAKLLGYRLCDDEIVAEALKDSGIDMDEATFRYYDESEGTASVKSMETLSNAQRFFKRSAVATLKNDVVPLDKRLDGAMRAVLTRLADEGNCIILGRCANYYLRGREDVVSMFFADTQEHKVKRIAAHLDVDDEAALRYIKKTDKRRSEFYSFFTGEKWDEAGNYDVRLNCALLGEEGSAQLIKDIVDLKSGNK